MSRLSTTPKRASASPAGKGLPKLAVTPTRPRGSSSGGGGGGGDTVPAAALTPERTPTQQNQAGRRLTELPSRRASGSTPIGGVLAPIELSPQPATAAQSSSSSVSSSSKGDAIQVCVRIRPGGSADDVSLHSWELSSDRTQLVDTARDGSASSADARGSGPGSFHFSRVFPPSATTEQLYNECISSGVQHYINGFNGTIFAYGQTASGKTFTISQLTSMAISQIFSSMSADPSRLYMLRCAHLEIYNEEINDLLAPTSSAAGGASGRSRQLRERDGVFQVQNLTEIVVTSAEEVFSVIERGNASRSVGVSNLNEHSSRSHAIFRLTLESAMKTDVVSPSASTSPAAPLQKLSGAVRISELNIVDLAGSETLTYEFGSSQQKETKAINVSLTNLKTVIQSLAKREQFVAYRNSCLTKLLRNSLGGNAKTTLICTMNSLPLHARVSRATLHFGQMAGSITNKAVVNETSDGEAAVMLKQYKARVEGLESRLADFARIEEEKSRLQREFLELQNHLFSLQAREAEQKRLQEELNDASKLIVGGVEAVAAATAKASALSPPSESGVSKEQLDALSSQLASLQTAKDELEQSKLALEARLLEQQRLREATEKGIQLAQQQLEDSAQRSEAEQQRLRKYEQQLQARSLEDAERQRRDKELQEQLAQAQRLSDEKIAQSAALAAQLESQQRLSEEKSAQSAALAAELEQARQLSAAKEAQSALLAQQLAEQKRISDEKLAHSAQLRVQLDAAAADMAAKEASLRAMQAAQREAADALAKQMRLLEDARAKQAQQKSDAARLRAEHDAKAAELQRALRAAKEHSAQISSAAADRWSRQLQLMSESGLDKDSYLAQLIDDYETRLDKATRANDELQSEKLVMQMEHENKLEMMKREHARRGSGGGHTAATLPIALPTKASSAFSQPTAPPASASSSSSSAAPLSLEIPGVISLAEGEALLATPVLKAHALCQTCGSMDRLRAEKLRSLAVHACKTLNHYHEQRTFQQRQIRDLQATIGIYEMQLKEYGMKKK